MKTKVALCIVLLLALTQMSSSVKVSVNKQTIPFIWQMARDITPLLDDRIHVDDLTEAFNGAGVYALSDQDGNSRYYSVKNGEAFFLFALEGTLIEYCDFDADGIGIEMITRKPVYDGKYQIGYDIIVSKYIGGVLRQSSLRELLGYDSVGIDGRYYCAYSIDDFLNLSMETAYLFEPGEMRFIEAVQAEPDKLGSWSSIGVSLERPEHWRKIVSSSEFQLGEEYLRGYWNTQNGREPYYGRRFGTYPNIDGSTVCVPLAMEFARQHLGMTDGQAREFVSFSKTALAYEALITRRKMNSSLYIYDNERQLMDDGRPLDIILATYPSDDECALADRYGEPLIIEPICSDAFIFIVNSSNPVESLTLDQARGIYSGRITNWSEVGGGDEPILAFQREPDSGSQTGLEQLVMKGEPLAKAPAAMIVLSMEGLIETVAEYDNGIASIGYSYKYYVEQLYRNENVKMLRINGFEPSGARGYPLGVNYYGVVRAKDGPESVGKKFLNWIRSEEGQSCIRLIGYTPPR